MLLLLITMSSSLPSSERAEQNNKIMRFALSLLVTICLVKRRHVFTCVLNTRGWHWRQNLLTQGMLPAKKLSKVRHCTYVRKIGTNTENLLREERTLSRRNYLHPYTTLTSATVGKVRNKPAVCTHSTRVSALLGIPAGSTLVRYVTAPVPLYR